MLRPCTLVRSAVKGALEDRWAGKCCLPQPCPVGVACPLLAQGPTTCLLSSAKVALTNMAPRAKPRLLSVSLTQNFQRGRQVCMAQEVVVTHGMAKAP